MRERAKPRTFEFPHTEFFGQSHGPRIRDRTKDNCDSGVQVKRNTRLVLSRY